MSYFNFSKSLITFFRLLVFLVSLFTFNLLATHIYLENNNLNCYDNECNFSIKKNQYFKPSKDKRVVNLIEVDENGKEKLINLLFYTTDIVDVVAYSGKPLEILISLDYEKLVIDNLKLVKHSEPILLTGIPIEKLLEAISFYKGKNIKNRINIGEDVGGEIGIPIIAGATVTSLILHDTILSAAREVGHLFYNDSNFIEGGLNNKFKKLSWEKLIDIRAVQHYCLDSFLRENTNADKSNLLIDIYFADLKHPSIGKNLLGENSYNELLNELGDDKSAIIILNNGSWSFKGSGFVRGGIFDRFRVEQENNVFTFRDSDLKHLYDLFSIDVDDFKESGIFLISHSKYKPYKSSKLILLFNYKTYSVDYTIPKSFCLKQDPAWLKAWKSKLFYIFLYLSLWLITISIFIFRYKLAKNSFYLSIAYNFVLLLDIYIIGILFEGQPSVVNIFSLIDDFKHIWVFLIDPCIFLGWIMIILTIFLWGKALFCGWICPFGALQEVIFKFRSLLFNNDHSFEFKLYITDKLKYLRYFIFIFLTIISFYNFEIAEIIAEIEPFKTTWILGIFNRPMFLALYTVGILIISVFTYRFFCRFFCPLGAFLSFLSFFAVFRLKRLGTCTVCNICKHSCNSRAIDSFGNIDVKECFGCFTCVNNMYNKSLCPPRKNKKVREKYEKIWID